VPRTAGPTVARRRTRAGRGRVPRRYLRRPLPSPRSRATPINTPHFPLFRRHCHAAAPFAPPPSSSAPSNFPYPFLRTYRAVACHLLSRLSPRHRRSRATADAVVGTHRTSTPECSPPQHWSPPGPRWAHGRAPPLPPSRERSRLARIWPASPPPLEKGRIASPKLFVGCFV
jgi:hypothetical protein